MSEAIRHNIKNCVLFIELLSARPCGTVIPYHLLSNLSTPKFQFSIDKMNSLVNHGLASSNDS